MIIIDGQTFNVPIIKISRKAEALDLFAERTEDGRLHRQLVGLYTNFSVQFGTGGDVMEYARLWDAITAPVEFHQVSIPDGNSMHTFECYFSNIGDEMFKYKDPQAFYKSLTLNMISRDPTRTL